MDISENQLGYVNLVAYLNTSDQSSMVYTKYIVPIYGT